jgi:hypothetical protein
MVEIIANMATLPSAAMEWSPEGRSFSTDSSKICRNDITIICEDQRGAKVLGRVVVCTIEKTKIPSGSSRRLPTGNRERSFPNFHWTSLFVVQIIKVQRRSSAESTREAIKERLIEKKTAHILAISSRTFARTLIYLPLEMSMSYDGPCAYVDCPFRAPL